MKSNFLNIIILGSMVTSLVATGGLGGEVGAGVGDGGANENLFNSLDAETNKLKGVAIQSAYGTSALTLLSSHGELVKSTGKTNINDGQYEIIDADGASDGGLMTDGKSTLTFNNSIGTEYKFVKGYDQSYEIAGNSFEVAGQIGLATLTSDIPNSGNHSYEGQASLTLIAGNTGVNLTNGKSKFGVNFETAKAKLVLNGFDAIDPITGKKTDAPIDSLTASDIALSQSGFSGSTITTQKADEAINITGANSLSSISGNFYGANSSQSRPAEAAGMIIIKGDEGIIFGNFAAN